MCTSYGCRSLLVLVASSTALAGVPRVEPAQSRGVAARAQPPATEVDDDDPEERAARREWTHRVVRENCLICHSDELIRSQRLTPKQWTTEVDKMIGWGSPLPADERRRVIDLLAAEYGPDAGLQPLERKTLREVAGPERPTPPAGRDGGSPARGKLLYARNCENCHGADGQGAELGPNLVEKPPLLDPAGYREVVRSGRGRMPGFANVLGAAAEADILAWLREQRYRPAPAARK